MFCQKFGLLLLGCWVSSTNVIIFVVFGYSWEKYQLSIQLDHMIMVFVMLILPKKEVFWMHLLPLPPQSSNLIYTRGMFLMSVEHLVHSKIYLVSPLAFGNTQFISQYWYNHFSPEGFQRGDMLPDVGKWLYHFAEGSAVKHHTHTNPNRIGAAYEKNLVDKID